ncbi:MAG: mechanosensitive ion channel [Spirochaetia bacterium]|jgi:potassium efflux system protein|nr:mechanosensitive ion channel [Spirochaetia bacterium]
MDYYSILKTIFLTPLSLGVLDFPFTLLELLLKLLLPMLLVFIVYRILNGLLRRILGKSNIRESIQKGILLWTRRVLRIIFLLVLFVLSGRLLGARIFEYIGLFVNILNKPLFESGNTKISFLTLLLIIPVFIIASWAGKTSRGLISKDLLNRMGLDEARQFSFSSLLRYGVMSLVFLIGLSIIGVNLSSITVMFGVLGIGVGFGLQGVVANLFAGIIIILSRPIKEGDRILVNDYEGTVKQIRILSTIINTITNESIIVPNARLVSDVVYNYSYSDRSIRVKNNVGVSYGANLELAVMLLQEIASSNPYALPNKEHEVRVEEFGSSGIEIIILTWIKDVVDKYKSRHWTNMEIWRVFKAKGIEIPFAQIDLHIKDGVIQSSRD